MCTQRNPNNFSERLYQRYQEVGKVFEKHDKSYLAMVLIHFILHSPMLMDGQSLREFCTRQFMPGFRQGLAQDTILLRELMARSVQLRSLVNEFQRPFHYLVRPISPLL